MATHLLLVAVIDFVFACDPHTTAGNGVFKTLQQIPGFVEVGQSAF